jgi:hypothetical protein
MACRPSLIKESLNYHLDYHYIFLDNHIALNHGLAGQPHLLIEDVAALASDQGMLFKTAYIGAIFAAFNQNVGTGRALRFTTAGVRPAQVIFESSL